MRKQSTAKSHIFHGICCSIPHEISLIARFIGPTWGPSGADRTQVGPMLAPWTLLSGMWHRLGVSCFVVVICCHLISQNKTRSNGPNSYFYQIKAYIKTIILLVGILANGIYKPYTLRCCGRNLQYFNANWCTSYIICLQLFVLAWLYHSDWCQ